MENITNVIKKCKTCKKELALISFYLRKAAPNRYQSDCKECYKEKRRARYAVEREIYEYKKYWRDYFVRKKVKGATSEGIKREKSKESYRRQKEKNDKYWFDRKIQKEINDLL